jgi:hypothetical protein
VGYWCGVFAAWVSPVIRIPRRWVSGVAIFSLLAGLVSVVQVASHQGDPRFRHAPKQMWRSAADLSHFAPAAATEVRPGAGTGSKKAGSVLAPPLVGPARRPDVPMGALPSAGSVPRPVMRSVGTAPRAEALAPEASPVRGFDPATSRELPDKRGARTRSFANADGTQTMQVYGEPVNYRRKDGSWAAIDTMLVPRGMADKTSSPTPHKSESPRTDVALPFAEAPSRSVGAGAGWTVKAAASAVGFGRYADDPSLVTVGVDDSHHVGYGIAGAAHVEGQASGEQVTYPGVFPDADVQLLGGDGQVKEQLILKSASAPMTWTFPLRLTGLRAQMADNGDVVFVDDAGTQRAYVPAGFMVDSKFDANTGEGARSDGVTYSVTMVNGEPVMRVQLDEAWLHDPARVFPVTVDPSVKRFSDSRDTYVMSGYKRDNSGDTEMKVGTYDGRHKARSFMGFGSVGSDLKNDYVLGAKLSLYNAYSHSCKSAPVYVRPITESWSVSTTTTWPGPSIGAVLGSRSFAHGFRKNGATSWACKPAWDGIDLGSSGVSLINGWTHGTKANNGLALVASEKSSSGYKRFTTGCVRKIVRG